MRISLTEFDANPILCDGCGSPVLRDHSDQGFGHYRRCCACYESRQRVVSTPPVSPIVHVLTHGFPCVPICVDPLRRTRVLWDHGRFLSDGMTVFPTHDPVDCMSCLVKETRKP